MRSFVLAAAAAGVMAAAAPSAFAAELITNGDFSAGNTGFATTYGYAGAGSTFQGNYWITDNPQTVCPTCFPAIGDHTTGSGKMMVIDGAGSTDYFYQVTVNVVPFTSYDFSMWATSLGTAGSTPNVVVQINGQQPLAVVLPNTSGQTSTTWNPIKTSWFAGANTTATIRLIDTNNVHEYNDLAVDDISFRGLAVDGPTGPTGPSAAPEPGTWALMILGFGLAGGALRRRAGVVA